MEKQAVNYIKPENIKTATLEEALKEAKEKHKDKVIFVIGSFYVYKKVMEIIDK